MSDQLALALQSAYNFDSLDAPDIEAALKWGEQPGHHLLRQEDEAYPELLKQIHDAPKILFVKGDLAVLSDPQIAVVGSRNMSPYGRDNAKAYASYLAGCGLTITSGMALGIDGVAHQAALEAGANTIAVLGTGIDVVYPKRHEDLYEKIAEQGAIVSEYPLGTPAIPNFFPRRNRIISGLSIGVLVVEAAIRSGSLSTARHAMEQNREVFAIPGSIHHPLSRGCHYLLKNGAKCVESGQDILEECQQQLASFLAANQGTPQLNPAANHVTPASVDSEYDHVLAAIGYEKTTTDQLVERTGLDPAEIASMLLMLELEGHIEQVYGGYMKKGTG